VRGTQPRRNEKEIPKLVAFDMDGTLLSGTPSWEMIHEHYGTMESARQSHIDYSSHKISYRQFMRRDVSAWPRPLKRAELMEALGQYRLRPEAPGVVDDLKLLGYEVAVISSGLDLIVRPVAKRLGIRYFLANRLGFDARGIFNGKVYPLVDPLRKDIALEGLALRLGVRLGDTICVGDSSYDESFLRAGGKAFVVGNPVLSAQLGVPNLTNLEELLEHLAIR